MNVRQVCILSPKDENSRNSEGDFLRAPNGDILFAYSRYRTQNSQDHAPCDIYMIRSSDEGESWSEPVIIASAAEFGVSNVMSVSGMIQKDGSLAFYFLIKENDFSTTIGRATSRNGLDFNAERTVSNYPRGFYVIHNARFERTSDSRIIAPAAYIPIEENEMGTYRCAFGTCLVSDDDGRSFKRTPHMFDASKAVNSNFGVQEPGILELYPGIFWVWIRTGAGYHYHCYSMNNLISFTPPEPSSFTSPISPMEVIRADEKTLYCVYNPTPNYNGRANTGWGWGRTPLVIRKSINNGVTWGKLNALESDTERGFCYPAMFLTNDGHMLCSYCSGGEDDKMCLCRLTISKILIDSIEI